MRSIRRFRPALALLACAAALAGCGDPSGSGGGTVGEDDLVFLRAAPGAPPLAFQERSVLVTAGDNAEIEIPYAPLPGETEGEDGLRFRVRGNGLLTRPDGTRFRRGDTVTITVRVVDAELFKFEFRPAGLRFDADHPAELRMDYRYAHPDYDGDGEVDDDDEEFEFGWWRQEAVGLPWQRIGSVRLHDRTEVRAELDGFTRYALAGGH